MEEGWRVKRVGHDKRQTERREPPRGETERRAIDAVVPQRRLCLVCQEFYYDPSILTSGF